jgi:Uncharacterised nucleotidyltransferase
VKLSPEWQVILACVKAEFPGEEFQRRARAHLTTLDWDHLTALVCRHGIAPLMYHQMYQFADSGTLPQDPMEGLRRTYYANVARNTLLYKELNAVLSALQEMRSQVIALKGTALAEMVYPHRGLRPMSDIDLLVRPEEVAGVEDRLIDLGYVLRPYSRGKTWFKAHHYHLSFMKPTATAGAIPLEMHWHIGRPSWLFMIDIESLWARAVPARIADADAWMFAPEDLLMHLCLHACKHKPTGSLRPLCDLAATIRRYGHTIDWEQLQTRAAHWSIAPYVYLPLQLARNLVGAAVPDPCSRALQPEGLNARLVSRAIAELLTDQRTTALFPELLRLWKGPRVSDRPAIVVKILSPATIAKAYGISPTSKRRYGYYPVRLKDLLRRYGSTLWRLCCREPQLTGSAEAKWQLAQWLQPFDQRGHDESSRAPQAHECR